MASRVMRRPSRIHGRSLWVLISRSNAPANDCRNVRCDVTDTMFFVLLFAVSAYDIVALKEGKIENFKSASLSRVKFFQIDFFFLGGG